MPGVANCALAVGAQIAIPEIVSLDEDDVGRRSGPAKAPGAHDVTDATAATRAIAPIVTNRAVRFMPGMVTRPKDEFAALGHSWRRCGTPVFASSR